MQTNMNGLEFVERAGKEVMWRYHGQAGVSRFEDGEIKDVKLCEDHFWLPPRVSREINQALQRYHDDEPKLTAKFAEWEAESERNRRAWNLWDTGTEEPVGLHTGKLKHALPSLDEYPDDLAHEGKCILFAQGDYTTFISPVLVRPTWGDVALQFDISIRVTDDLHHVFLEGLDAAVQEDLPQEIRDGAAKLGSDIALLEICTGS